MIQPGLLQLQMEGFRGQAHSLADFRIEVNQQFTAGRHVHRGAAEQKLVAAGIDVYTQALFDLAQMRIQLATEFGQVTGIVGFQGEALLGCRLGGRFAVQSVL